MHEHVFMLHPEIIENVETDWDEETALVDAARRLDELYAAGIHTIVDLTVIGLGRSAGCSGCRRAVESISLWQQAFTHSSTSRPISSSGNPRCWSTTSSVKS